MTNDLMTTFLALCDPFREEIPGDISEASWTHISHLAKLHGVTPFLYYRTRSLGISLPEQLEKEWLGHYLYQIAEEKKARCQIKELKEILDPEGIPFILLKGASAMLRLYPQPGLRTFIDLDILIPEERVTKFKIVMKKSGYIPLAARNSLEEEELVKFDCHLNPFSKEGGLAVEPHLNILRGRGEYSIALPEIWRDRGETKPGDIIVGHLSKEHFIIHTLLHCIQHLSEEGFIEIKGFIDLLFAIRTWKIDWSEIMEVSHRWSVEKDVFPSIATLNHYWGAVSLVTEKAIPLDLHTLVLGIKNRQKQYYAKLPARYFKHLLKIRMLPDIVSQFRYLFHTFFPTRENLRFRYHLSSKKAILPYYLIHLLFLSRKFFKGLWQQLLFHTQ